MDSFTVDKIAKAYLYNEDDFIRECMIAALKEVNDKNPYSTHFAIMECLDSLHDHMDEVSGSFDIEDRGLCYEITLFKNYEKSSEDWILAKFEIGKEELE